MCGKLDAIVFDLDGTIFEDFLKRDEFHIRRIFEENKLVLFIDTIARFINSFDILKNNTFLLKVRLKLYSILSLKNHSEVLEAYKSWYKEELKWAIISQIPKLKYVRRYKIIVLSNNLFSNDVVIGPEYLTECNFCFITSKGKFKSLKDLKKDYNIKFMVGNNFLDDIFPANILGIKTIYFGKNTIVKALSKYSTEHFDKIISIINSN